MLARWFAIDPRALAALRIGAATLLAIDVAARLSATEWFGTDLGLLPRSAVVARGTGLAFLSGSPAAAIALHLATLSAALWLASGRAARSAALAAWIGFSAIHLRSPTIGNAGDLILTQLLFWMIWLPIGARWALRSPAARAGVPAGASVLSPASVGLALLMPGIYFSSVFHKVRGDGWLDGTIVHYTVSNERWATAFGGLLDAIPGATAALTWGTLALEFVGPLMLFAPVATRPLRLAAIASFLGLQAGIGLSIELWLFPFISSLALVPLVPALVWDRVFGPDGAPTAPVRGLPDGVFRPLALAASAAALLAMLASHLECQFLESGRRPITRALGHVGLRQNWIMYSSQRTWNERVLLRASAVGGAPVWLDDRGATARWEPLARLQESYRGRRHLVRLEYHRRPRELAAFGDWVCRTHDDAPLSSVTIIGWRQPIDAQGDDEVQERVLRTHRCR